MRPNSCSGIRAALAGAAFGCLAVPQPAFASALDEILVTATKRHENLQDIPISLVAVGGDLIRNDVIRDIEQLSVRVPNLNVGKGLTTDNVHIRGIGSGNERSFEQAVAMYIDGIYMPRSRQYRTPFLDVERVEVARGPQAVMFGLNASAGAISVHTARSRPGDDWFADLTAEYETEFGGTAVTTVIGGSPSESLGLRFAARAYDSGDGYWTNIVTGSDENSVEDTLVRGSLVWTPSSAVTLDAKAEYSDFKREGFLDELYSAVGSYSDGVDELNWVRGQEGSLLPLFREPATPGFGGELLNVAVSVDYEIGNGTITGLLGYSDYDWNIFADLDSSGLAIIDSGIVEQFELTSIELRYTSSDDAPLRYLLGAYLSANTLDNEQGNIVQGDILLAGTGFPVAGFDAGRLWSESSFEQDENLYSAFGELIYDISDRFRLRGGMRFVRSEKDHVRSVECLVRRSDGDFDEPDPTGNPNDLLLMTIGFCPSVVDPPERSRSADSLMPEIGAQWTLDGETMLYGKASTSTKSGGFVASTIVVPGFFEYDDETGLGIEVGLKTSFNDGSGTLDVAVFHTTYDDLQVNSFDPETAASIVRNAGEARSQGVELDLRWAVSESLTTGASVAWLDAEFKSFESGQCYPGEPANPDGINCDKTGDRLPFAPEFSGNVFADIGFPVSTNLELLAGVNVAYSDDYFTNGTLDPVAVQDAYTKIDARIGIGGADGTWNLSLVGKNLTEEVVNDFTEAFLGVYRGYIQEPRTVWVQGRYRF